MVKNLPAMQKTRVWSLGQEDPLEMKMATHSRTLAWKIPWTEEPGGATVHGVAKSKTWLSNFTFFHFLVIGKACVNLEIQWWRWQALFSCLIDVRMPTDGREAGRAWCAQDCMGWGRARGTKRTPDGHAANPDLGGQGRLPYVVTSGLKGKQWGVSAPDTHTHTHTHTLLGPTPSKSGGADRIPVSGTLASSSGSSLLPGEAEARWAIPVWLLFNPHLSLTQKGRNKRAGRGLALFRAVPPMPSTGRDGTQTLWRENELDRWPSLQFF